MFKTLFSKKSSIDKIAFPEGDVALRLMFEVAMSDGHLDKAELELIKNRVREISPQDTSVSGVIKKMIVYAIIPARSGSKGVTNKNISLVDGKPLLSYSIIFAKKMPLTKLIRKQ